MNELELNKIIKKSNFNAKTIYDYKLIEKQNDNFVKCTIEEKEEELNFTFQINEMEVFSKIRKEKKEIRLLALIDITKFKELIDKFSFSLCPDNLYFDYYGKIKVCMRDISREEASSFLTDYKSIIGFALQERYTFEDYQNGGLKLLCKDKFLKQIYDAEDMSKIESILLEEYKKVMKESKNKKMDILKTTYKKMKYSLIVIGSILFVLVLYNIFYYSNTDKKNRAVINGFEEYISEDYIATMDALSKLKVSSMSKYSLFIAATSYVKAENLTQEQKDLILSELELDGNRKEAEYWVYLGRTDMESAEDRAKQLSNDEWLLYAYMKERALLESNTEISGEKKEARLNELITLIDSLSEKYNTEEAE